MSAKDSPDETSSIILTLIVFSEHHWPWTSQCEHLQYQTLYLQYQPKQFIYYSCKKSNGKRRPRVKNLEETSKILKLEDSCPPSHYSSINGTGNSCLFSECQMIWIKWWLGFSRDNGTDHPWILQLLLQQCSGEAPAAPTAASPALWGMEKVGRLLFPLFSVKQAAPLQASHLLVCILEFNAPKGVHLPKISVEHKSTFKQ